MTDYWVLLGGVVCAALGGELFVRGAVGVAYIFRIAPAVVGATVAAFATSSPELSVAVSASLAGTPQITLGDALGSNIANVALILGVALLFGGLHCARESIRRDFPVAIAVPVITALLLLDGELSRLDGIFLAAIFVVWLLWSVVVARRQRLAIPAGEGRQNITKIIGYLLVGLLLLVASGKLIVSGARGVALTFGLSEFVVGAVIVAVGTSVPELATTLISRWRGFDDIGLGTILGSNIFNGYFIVAVAAILHPIALPLSSALPALLTGAVVLLMAFPGRDALMTRQQGVILLLMYVSYSVWLTLHG